MSLVTYQRYVAITGDETSGEYQVSARIEEATQRIEERLNGRLLVASARTETLRMTRDYRVFPHAIPVTTVPVDASYQIESTTILRSVSPDDWWGTWGTWSYCDWPLASVEYEGGYTSATVPKDLERAIAFLAYGAREPGASRLVFAGATSISLGDASVGYGRGLSGLDADLPGLESLIRRYRYRRFTT